MFKLEETDTLRCLGNPCFPIRGRLLLIGAADDELCSFFKEGRTTISKMCKFITTQKYKMILSKEEIEV
jgi:hypothetical protein